MALATAYGPEISPMPISTPTANSSGNAGTTAPTTISASRKATAKTTAPARMGWFPIQASTASIQEESMARIIGGASRRQA